MHEWESLSHVKWECKYHVVFVPKYRRKAIYGELRQKIGRILRELCEQRGVELLEGHAMLDHVHKGSCVSTIGYDEAAVRRYIREQEEKDESQAKFDFD